MTIKIPERTIGDKILDLLGKKRAVFVPKDIYREYGKYAYGKAQRESFWKALLRKKGARLPEDWVHVQDVRSSDNSA